MRNCSALTLSILPTNHGEDSRGALDETDIMMLELYLLQTHTATDLASQLPAHCNYSYTQPLIALCATQKVAMVAYSKSLYAIVRVTQKVAYSKSLYAIVRLLIQRAFVSIFQRGEFDCYIGDYRAQTCYHHVLLQNWKLVVMLAVFMQGWVYTCIYTHGGVATHTYTRLAFQLPSTLCVATYGIGSTGRQASTRVQCAVLQSRLSLCPSLHKEWTQISVTCHCPTNTL